MTSHEFHRQRMLEQLADIGIGFKPRKKQPRIAEIVGIHCLVVAGIVAVGFVWSRLA